MNYIAQLNAFFDRLPTRPLSTDAVALWCLLHHLANRAGWPRGGLAVREDAIRGILGIGHGTFVRARAELVAAGLVYHLSQRGNKPPVYVLKVLANPSEPSVDKSVHNHLVLIHKKD